MNHDRLHARKPTHDIDRWSTGTVEAIETRDGHCVVTVVTTDNEQVELVVTFAIRDRFAVGWLSTTGSRRLASASGSGLMAAEELQTH
jgi:hypothetical protein